MHVKLLLMSQDEIHDDETKLTKQAKPFKWISILLLAILFAAGVTFQLANKRYKIYHTYLM